MADLLRSQKAYYDARAHEYDDFWLRRGSYALDEPLAGRWAADAAATLDVVTAHARGRVLELAAGTGIFTEHLAGVATSVHAVDASPRMLARNRARVGGTGRVTHEQADLFAWAPEERYDTVFFGFWLSHVPDDRLGAFWAMVGGALAPGGRVVLVDSCAYPAESGAPGDRVEERRLSTGERFDVVKRYWSPEELAADVSGRGWSAAIERSTHGLMLRGTASPAGATPAGPATAQEP